MHMYLIKKVQNTNKQLRRFVPKKSIVSSLNDNHLIAVSDQSNKKD